MIKHREKMFEFVSKEFIDSIELNEWVDTLDTSMKRDIIGVLFDRKGSFDTETNNIHKIFRAILKSIR